MRFFSEQKWINILLLVSLLMLTLSGVLAIYQNSQLIAANDQVLRIQQVLYKANELRYNITELEEKKNTKSFYSLALVPKKTLESLKSVTKNLEQQYRLNRLETLLDHEIKFLHGSLLTTKANRGVSYASPLFDLINDFTYAELKILENRNTTLSDAITKNNIYLISTLIFCFLTILLSTYLLNHHLYNRRIAESKLRENELYNSTILHAASDCIITLDRSARIISCNQQTLTAFHYSDVEIKEKSIDEIIPNLSKHLQALVGKSAQEVIGKTSQLENTYGEITISQASLNGQTIYICIFRDISERKKIDKMKNEFISTVSHELRTPLTAIHGSIMLLLNDVTEKLAPGTVELLDVAKRNAERLIRLINDILDVERIESGNMEFDYKIIEINACAQEAIAVNQSYADKYHIKLNLIPSPAKVYVYADHDRLLQVFTNLLSNAIKFSSKKAEVTISIVTTPENFVRVKIIDQGQGISEEFKKRIFQKFAQEDSSSAREHEGTGLGLSICKAIVEILHGKIHYVSHSAPGTTFYFDLPIYVPVDYNISAEEVIHEKETN